MTTRPASSDIRLHRQRAQDGQVCGRESPTPPSGTPQIVRFGIPSCSQKTRPSTPGLRFAVSGLHSRAPAAHHPDEIRSNFKRGDGVTQRCEMVSPRFLRRISTRGAMLTALRGLAVVGRRFPMPQTVAKLWTASRKRSPICLNSAGERMRMRGVESNR